MGGRALMPSRILGQEIILDRIITTAEVPIVDTLLSSPNTALELWSTKSENKKKNIENTKLLQKA